MQWLCGRCWPMGQWAAAAAPPLPQQRQQSGITCCRVAGLLPHPDSLYSAGEAPVSQCMHHCKPRNELVSSLAAAGSTDLAPWHCVLTCTAAAGCTTWRVLRAGHHPAGRDTLMVHSGGTLVVHPADAIPAPSGPALAPAVILTRIAPACSSFKCCCPLRGELNRRGRW